MQIERDFVKFELKGARIKIAKFLFDTDAIKKPFTFLRRFWASTGVLKTKPLNEVVGHLMNRQE